MPFIHKTLTVPELERFHIDGKRFYKKINSDAISNYISITTVTSHYNKEKFKSWRERVGEEEANRIKKAATTRGTQMHSLVEHYLGNENLPKSAPLPKLLFDVAKPELNKINNIYALEKSLYSKVLGVAGTVDCIAEYNKELAIIDFKTSKKPKPRERIEHYFVQAAAYGCMLYELTGIPVKKLVIIMACENGECKVYEEYDKAKYIKLLSKYIREFVRDKLELYGKR